MAYNYDALYRTTKDALGAPTKKIVDAFAALDGRRLRVLDVGCGQGRDALFIARLGHHVTGVDISTSGISAMIAAAKAEGLSVEGVVADIREFQTEQLYDVILFDRTLHMLAELQRLDVLGRLIGCVDQAGRVLIADERSNIPAFEAALLSDSRNWEIELRDRGYLFARRQ